MRRAWSILVGSVAMCGFLAAICTWAATQSRGFASPTEAVIYFVLRLIEGVIAIYAICFVIASFRYLILYTRPQRTNAPTEPDQWPRAAIVYLCCGDLDNEAMRSLGRLEYPGRLLHILHDDSDDPEARHRVDELVVRLRAQDGVEWRVLRRPQKGGGKPGALQYILDATADEHDVFLLADNDSRAPDPLVLRRAIPALMQDGVACVQFRNQRRAADDEGAFASWVSASIDIFDAFTTGMFEPLWKPFVGHNAVLRTRDVIDAGGFTPGVFADDLDLTIRLNDRGKRVVHRRDLVMQETHPGNYRSFCLRSKKWATGCAQVLRMHLGRVLASEEMTLREKLGFMLFCGFFVAQAATLLYAIMVFMVLPPLTGATLWTASPGAILVGTLVPFTVFLPILAYLATEGRALPRLRTLASCAGAYGSTDLWTVLGLKAGLFPKGDSRWIPTNGVRRTDRPLLDWSHFAFGALFLLVPLLWQPALLLFPMTWLFAAKYLFVPAVAAHYVERSATSAPAISAPPQPLRITAMLAAILLPVLALPSAADASNAAPIPGFEQHEIIKGVHFTPWRPGTGPGRGFDYPSDDALRQDLATIAETNANAIIAYDPPPRLLDLAQEYDLQVFYVFNVDWWRLPTEAHDPIIDTIVARIVEMRDSESVSAWILGNEAPGWVIDKLGPDGLRGFLSTARRRIRAEADDTRPIAYGNWPLHRTLDLDRDMDIVAYNIYPFYPTEVAVLGYRRFIEREIMPLARGRPVLITEFGINAIEASPLHQADIIVNCWRDLLEAGAVGGFVFSFADEWWKNYDNPVAPPDWWRRVEAPDDHLTHDQDPEEHFGIVDSDRKPKPAFHAVRAMFAMSAGRPEAAIESPGDTKSVASLPWWVAAAFAGALLAIAVLLRLRVPRTHHAAADVAARKE